MPGSTVGSSTECATRFRGPAVSGKGGGFIAATISVMCQQAIALRDATQADAAAIAAIYNYYVLKSVATFEETEISVVDAADRICKVLGEGLPWLVAEQIPPLETGSRGERGSQGEEGSRILGYAYAGRWSTRAAYRYTAEITVYLASNVRSRGVGSLLYGELFSRLARLGIRSVIAGITLPNPSSVAIHEKFGMRKVGHFENVGYKFDSWLDVGYWQTQLTESQYAPIKID